MKFKSAFLLLDLIEGDPIVALRGLGPAILTSIERRVELLLAAYVSEALCLVKISFVELKQFVLFLVLRLLILVLEKACQRVVASTVV